MRLYDRPAHQWYRFLSKLRWELNPQELLRHARVVADTATRRLEGDGYYDSGNCLRLFDRFARAKAALRKLPEEAAALLLTDSISPIPLHKTLVLLDALSDVCGLPEDESLWKAGCDFIVRDLPRTEEKLRAIPPFEFENWYGVSWACLSC